MALAVAMFGLAAIVIGWPWLSGRDHPLGRPRRISSRRSNSSPRASPGPIAVLGALRVQRPSTDRRPAIDDLLAAVPGAGAHPMVRPACGRSMPTVLVMVALGGVALMLFFRDRGWHWAGGLVAALAFSYGASMAWRIQHTGQVLSLAYLPIALVCLDRALARTSVLYGVAAGIVAAVMLGRDQVALLAVYLLAAFGLWRVLSAEHPRAAMRASLLPLGAGAVCALAIVAAPVMLTAVLAQEFEPRLDRLYRGGARLAASRFAADHGDAGRVRRRGAHGGLLGAAELRLARYGPLHRPEHGPALHRGDFARPAAERPPVRGQLWAPEIRFFACTAVVALLYALGWYTPVFPRPFRAGARGQSLPPAGGCDVSDRRPDRNSGRVGGANRLLMRDPSP